MRKIILKYPTDSYNILLMPEALDFKVRPQCCQSVHTSSSGVSAQVSMALFCTVTPNKAKTHFIHGFAS